MQQHGKGLCPICGRSHQEVGSDWCPHCGFKVGNREHQEELDGNTARDYFEWLRSLLGFLPYLRQKPKVAEVIDPGVDEDGTMILPYLRYCKEFEEFEACFWAKGRWHLPPYIETLNEKRIKLPITPRSRKVKHIDMVGLLALLVWSFRGERFCTGFMEGNVEDGTYVTLLERLKELLDDLGMDTTVESAISLGEDKR